MLSLLRHEKKISYFVLSDNETGNGKSLNKPR